MKTAKVGGGRLPAAILLLCLLIVSLSAPEAHSSPNSTSQIPARWSYSLPSTTCSSSGSNRDCHRASPAIVDVNLDGTKDIVVATNNGHVLAFAGNGTLLWDTDTGPAYGVSSGGQRIESSPAVADIDGDGRPEIVVGTGDNNTSGCHPGGVIVLEDDGRVKGNWPRLTVDEHIPPANCPDPVFSTPAVGDLDRDGDLEIVAASHGRRIYAWHHDGSLVAGFPPDSALIERFGPLGWDGVVGKLLDTIWSSPALADVDGDGYLDILIGTDEGNFDSTWPGDAQGWSCPYNTGGSGYCGGTLYGLNRFGDLLPGFPIRILETIQSTPALYDLDRDGKTEIFVGTGTHYNKTSSDHPTNGFRLYGWDYQGRDLPGWEGGRPVGGTVPASPVIGDIAGDDEPEIIVAAMDKKLYAWHYNGQPVSGFPMTPVNHDGHAFDQNVGRSLALVDYDGDDKMEILMTLGWSVGIIDGDGQILTTTNYPSDTRPFYFAEGTLQNTPAVGDLDNDGDLEMVVNNSRLYVWDLPGHARRSDWPMLKNNAARTSTPVPRLAVTPGAIEVFHEKDDGNEIVVPVTITNEGLASFNWSATVSAPDRLWVSPAQGTVSRSATFDLHMRLDGLDPGRYDLGKILVVADGAAGAVENGTQVVSISATIVDVKYQVYLPLARK